MFLIIFAMLVATILIILKKQKNVETSDEINISQKIVISKDELIDRLRPYFKAKVLTEILYISDDMCVFNYGDLNYAAFACVLYNNQYPFGIIIPSEYIEEHVDNHMLFFETIKHHLSINNKHLLHFSEENINKYISFLEEKRHKLPSKIDFNLNKRLKIKSKYEIEGI